MCPRVKSRPKAIPKSTVAKLWILLVGVNQYQDEENLPSLQYSALDCQGLGEALKEATAAFESKEMIVHHDFVAQKPQLAAVNSNLQHIVEAAQPDDTILFYFSGHGILETETQQVVLCLNDTRKDRLLATGLALNDLLQQLGNCAASQQLVWLDACHSGGMTLRGTNRVSLADPTLQLVKVLRHKASQSKGFYALLSCDRAQQSWEFPELGHGVFTYYLMRGLRGEAADAQGTIEADALYQYVYHQTLRYIDKTNQQIRLINQQKSSRGESRLQSEFPLQTPKRIVEGFGKVILGKRSPGEVEANPRQALVIDGSLKGNKVTLDLSKVLQGSGNFTIDYFPQNNKKWTEVRKAIATCLNSQLSSQAEIDGEIATALLYLRGRIETTEEEAWLLLRDGVRLSRSWLRSCLRNSRAVQQIVILDCPGEEGLAEWVEDLQLESERGQCLIAANATGDRPQQFTEILLQTLETADTQTGLPVAAWISQLQVALADTQITPQVWLSGTRGVIEVLPAKNGHGKPEDNNFDLGICPYMGLQAFTEENAEYFYGRVNLVQRLLNQINHHATMAVVGASGSGKSSAVQAGLIAQLRQGKQIPQSDCWWLACFRPGNNPLKALAKALATGETKKVKAERQLQIEGLLYQGVEGFVQCLRTRPEPMVLLAIDQFEELFTLSPTIERQKFIELILGAVEYASDRFKLVLTVRADFVASCLEIPQLAKILQKNSVLVPPYLTEEDYRAAIVKPAEQVGLTVESGLVAILLQDLDRSAGDLPLLQFVLQQLWERRQNGTLTLEAYEQLGGIKGALERQAQSVYDSLDPQAQECARWIFLNLTQLGEGTEDTRRRIAKSDLIVAKYPTNLVEKTLDTLTAAKLLVVNLDRGVNIGQSRSGDTPPEDDELFLEAIQQEATIEVVHEILIRHWTTLRWWLEENRSRLRSQRQIEQAAILWQQKDKQPDFLLRGVRLAEAEEIYIKYTDELTNLAKTFIAACIDARLEVQREAKRRLRKAQLTAAVLGILGLTATALGGLTYRQKLITQIENIDTLSASAEALLKSNQQLESLIASVKAGKQLKRIGDWGQKLVGKNNWEDTQIKTAATLQQALYSTQELNRLQSHAQKVNAVAYSPDGKLMATASDDGTVKIWNRQGSLISSLNAHQGKVTNLTFSPQQTAPYLLASASADRTIKLWQVDGKQAKPLQKIVGHQNWITDVAFSDDGTILASASRDGTIRLWDRDGILIKVLSVGKGWINTLDFAPSSQFASSSYILASGGVGNKIDLWQVNRNGGKKIKEIVGHKDDITHLKFSSNGQLLASASDDGLVKLWQVSNSKLINSYFHQVPVNRLSLSDDNQLLATSTIDGKISIWHQDGLLQQTLRGHTGEIIDVEFKPLNLPVDPNCQSETCFEEPTTRQLYTLASTGVDKTVRLWQISNDFSNNAGGVYSVAVSPTSPNIFAAGGWNGKIKLWLKNDGGTQQLLKTLPGHKQTITQVKFSPDGKLIASASWDKTIKIWDAKNGELIDTLQHHQSGINSIAFSPNSKLLAAASEDKTISIWQLNGNQAQLLQTLPGHQDSVKSITFSPDGKLIASGSYDKTIKLWDLKGNLLNTLEGHKLAITALEFSPDRNLLASSSWDNTIKLWQINHRGQGSQLYILSGHQDGVTSLDFNSTGTILASGSGDRKIKLWDINQGILVKDIQGHPSQINSIAFTVDDRTIISADEQQGLFWWDLAIDQLLTQGCARLSSYLNNNPTISPGDRAICSD